MRATHTPGRPGWDQGGREDGSRARRFFSHTTPAFPAPLAPSLLRQHGRQFTATPRRIDRALLQRRWIDAAMEVRFERTGACGGSPGAWPLHQPRGALAGKAMAPLAQGSRGTRERVGDGLQTLPCDDGAYGVGTAEHPGCFRLLEEGVQGRQGIIGKVQGEGPPMRGSRHKVLHKYAHATSHDAVPLLSVQNLSDSNFPEAA